MKIIKGELQDIDVELGQQIENLYADANNPIRKGRFLGFGKLRLNKSCGIIHFQYVVKMKTSVGIVKIPNDKKSKWLIHNK